MSRRPPWWTLAAFGLLMVTPAPWFGIALVALIGSSLLVRTLRRSGGRAVEPDAVALGRDQRGALVILSDRQLAAHGLVLGASGTGKSTTLARVLADRIQRGLPVVAIDLKGSPAFARSLTDAATRAGRPCQVFSLDGDRRWNPLAHGDPSELKDKLIATERFTEPHYRRAAERYLQTALTVLAVVAPERPPSLSAVVALCEPRRLAAAARRVPGPLGDRVRDYVAGLSPDQVSAVRGLGTRLAIVTESRAGSLLEPGAPEIDLRAALRGETVVVFSLNSSTYGSLAAQLGTMAVQDLVSAAGARLGTPESARPALVALDEFSALGADQVVALFARGREAGLGLLLATQEFSDLDRAARGLRDQVTGNTAVKIIHRQDVPASALAAAQMTGTERVWEETRQFGGRGGFLPRGTRHEVDRFRVAPDTIASLPTGAAVIITKVPQTDVRLVRVDPAPAPATGARPARPAAPPPATRMAAPGVRSRPPASRPRAVRRPPERHGPELG